MTTWREMLAMDLDLPKYKTTLIEAVGFRLRRNYIAVFSILLGAWMVKLMVHPFAATSFDQVWDRVAVGGIGAWFVVGGGAFFYLALFAISSLGRHIHGAEPEDEIAGIERNLEHWKL